MVKRRDRVRDLTPEKLQMWKERLALAEPGKGLGWHGPVPRPRYFLEFPKPDYPLTVAEIGSNHMGEAQKGIDLIKYAADAGCQIVKFQWIDMERVWEQPGLRPSWTAVSFEFLQQMAEECQLANIEFMCTPTAPWQVPKLQPLVQRWKIAAAHWYDSELEIAIRRTGKAAMASTSFVEPREVQRKYWYLPLLCVSKYPADPADYHMKDWLKRIATDRWGLSDHTPGYGLALLAATNGAEVIEKHFKLPNQPDSPDSGAHALTPLEMGKFTKMVAEVRVQSEGKYAVLPPPKGRRIWVNS